MLRFNKSFNSIGIEKAHFYGVRTGTIIASEVAINFPERVESLMIDELVTSDHLIITQILESHVRSQCVGSQFTWAWHVMRDHFIYHPWSDRYAQNE